MDFLDDEQVTPRNISNSEVTCFLSCKRQYEYAFGMQLAPKELSDPLARGSVGHHYLELYWKARMKGLSHDDSMEAANEAFITPCEKIDVALLMQTQLLVTRFVTAHEVEWRDWKAIGVEEQHDLKLTASLNMTIKYDLYYLHVPTNKYYILDWKFAYDFWNEYDHDLNGQMPKYIAVMQGNGYRVDGGQLQEIRTRSLGAEKQRDPKNLWRRTPYLPSNARKQSVLRQHIAASLEIERHRNLPDDERRLAALPVLNKHGACKFCNFKDLCNAELEGKRDLSVDIRVGYTKSTYGYNNTEAPGTQFDIL